MGMFNNEIKKKEKEGIKKNYRRVTTQPGVCFTKVFMA